MRMKEKMRTLKEKIDIQTRETGIAQVTAFYQLVLRYSKDKTYTFHNRCGTLSSKLKQSARFRKKNNTNMANFAI